MGNPLNYELPAWSRPQHDPIVADPQSKSLTLDQPLHIMMRRRGALYESRNPIHDSVAIGQRDSPQFLSCAPDETAASDGDNNLVSSPGSRLPDTSYSAAIFSASPAFISAAFASTSSTI